MKVPEQDGHSNMASDVELLERAVQGSPGFRIYTWHGVWVSLGMRQQPGDVLIDPETTQWVRRPTGGAAVLHGHDVTVAIAVPLSSKELRSYRLVTAPLVAALEEAGIDAAISEDLECEKGGLDVADCFARVSRNDIVSRSTQRKICGCALRRVRNAVLLQASIPAREPIQAARELIRGGVEQAITPVDPEELCAAVGRHLQFNAGRILSVAQTST